MIEKILKFLHKYRNLIFFSLMLLLKNYTFSIPLKYESFDIENLCNSVIIVKFEYNFYQNGEFYMQKIENIEIVLRFFIEDIEISSFGHSESINVLINPNNIINIINYSPFSDMSLSRLNKISPSKKIKSLFKSFSVQTINGRYLISCLEDINDEIIVIKGDRYCLIIDEELLKTNVNE